MSYAGLCGSTDLQKNSDAYFHGVSLHDIRNLLLAQPTCGEDAGIPDQEPVVLDLPVECKIPSGNYFQLRVDAPKGWFVQWDQFDPLPGESYLSRNVPRFRS